MSVNPRKIMGIQPAKIAVGERCDLAVFDPDFEWVVDKDKLHSKSKNSVFKNEKFKGKVIYTICKGKIVFALN